MELIQVSAAVSLDGFIDDNHSDRLLLSSPEDFEDMYKYRAECDAILIGANTVRRDNPSLLFRYPDLVEKRVRSGRLPELIKVTLTNSGELDPKSSFFSKGDILKVVLCPPQMEAAIRARLNDVAEIIPVNPLEPQTIVTALQALGIKKLFVEGGTRVLTAFIKSGIFHGIRLAIAPFFVGDDRAPRLVGNGPFVHDKNNRLKVDRVRCLGETTVIDLTNKNVPNF